MTILDRYIRNHVISATLLVVLILVGVESFIEFIGQLSSIGKAHFGILQVLFYVSMQLPSDLYQLFPMAGFLGSLMGLGRLASSSQLIVMRSAGVSIAQIVWSVIKAAVIMIVVVTFIGEWLAPKLQFNAYKIRSQALLHAPKGLQSLNGVWLRQGNSFVSIGILKSPRHVYQVMRYNFTPDHRLLSASFAQEGVLEKGHWELYGIRKTIFGKHSIKVKKIAKQPLGLMFKPLLLLQSRKKVDQESVLGLLGNIRYRDKTGLTSSRYKFALWQRIFQPLTTIVMICLGIPFIFGSLRTASTGLRVITGIIVGFGFYMLNQFFGPITLLYQFPPLLAAMLPTVLFMSAYGILIGRVR